MRVAAACVDAVVGVGSVVFGGNGVHVGGVVVVGSMMPITCVGVGCCYGDGVGLL